MDGYTFAKIFCVYYFIIMKRYPCFENITRNRNLTDLFSLETSTWNILNISSIDAVTKDTNVTQSTETPILQEENVTITEDSQKSTIYRQTGKCDFAK